MIRRMLGQEHILNALRDAHRRNTVHHSYLFVGPDGLGQEEVSLWFAQMVNCDTADDAPCGVCHPCRLIAAGNHPDFTWIRPDEKTKRGRVTIEQTRHIRWLVSGVPTLARRRVIVMTAAEQMMPEAAGSLLKTLEEPPEHSTLILIARNVTDVLPTILSRCQVQRFLPVPTEVVTSFLMERGVGEAEAAKLAALCDGRPPEAERLRNEPDLLAGRDVTLDWLEDLSRAGLGDALLMAERLRTTSDEMPGELESRLHWITLWYRDVMAAQSAGIEAVLYHPDRAESIAGAARLYPEGFPSSAIQAVGKARRYLSGNGNATLVTEDLVMNLIPAGGRP